MKNFWRSRCESMKQQARKHMYIRSLWNSWSMHSIHFLEFFLIFGWFFLQRVYKRALEVIFLVLYSSKWWATSVAELESTSALEIWAWHPSKHSRSSNYEENARLWGYIWGSRRDHRNADGKPQHRCWWPCLLLLTTYLV